ncbi:hypothetical protein AKG11_15030 [Shinella sp. SUS2]|jgi:hypothetical protein|uniref:hypothetical protein n=1 Tax=unclassified Shinella TaxID=2643062 RepID=UPI0003C52F66|nr:MULTISPECIES: hypothetical protein [unclassified Shinella]MCA0338926.1 hypothetical protein [Pseudomonadota bacterium]EYR82147.1 hypothetical protein SHLA_17c000760 [Shinella sp. DD12]KNY15960.1 hypothetical protein AKG11_15030 [Shinella sp. SUS2]KOC73450.1 hypothetical protein AKG10_22460 [Shinella sp. GWS1]MDG4670291.1 hypothetical protein [Shinella sp. 838]
MTSPKAQGDPKRPSPDEHKPRNDVEPGDTTAEPETEAEKTRREQATKPALMPIGDPAGAA